MAREQLLVFLIPMLVLLSLPLRRRSLPWIWYGANRLSPPLQFIVHNSLGAIHFRNTSTKGIGWDANIANPVGSEYIIMEEARGTQLSEIWDTMELEDQLKIIEDQVKMDSKFLSASFSVSGALYYANPYSMAASPRSSPAISQSPSKKKSGLSLSLVLRSNGDFGRKRGQI